MINIKWNKYRKISAESREQFCDTDTNKESEDYEKGFETNLCYIFLWKFFLFSLIIFKIYISYDTSYFWKFLAKIKPIDINKNIQ